MVKRWGWMREKFQIRTTPELGSSGYVHRIQVSAHPLGSWNFQVISSTRGAKSMRAWVGAAVFRESDQAKWFSEEWSAGTWWVHREMELMATELHVRQGGEGVRWDWHVSLNGLHFSKLLTSERIPIWVRWINIYSHTPSNSMGFGECREGRWETTFAHSLMGKLIPYLVEKYRMNESINQNSKWNSFSVFVCWRIYVS